MKHTFNKVTLETWIESGCQQGAQFWAVAANDLYALKQLEMENVTLQRKAEKPGQAVQPPWGLELRDQPGEPDLGGGEAEPDHVAGVILNSREQFRI